MPPPIQAIPIVGTPAQSQAAMAQAMTLLGNQIGVLTGAINKEVAILSGAGGRTASGGSSGGGVVSGLLAKGGADPAALIGMFVGKIAAVVGPLAVLGSAISSHTSGFETFLVTGKMLGVVLGGLLMPGFIVLAGSTYALAKMLDEVITPNLEYLFAFVIGDLIREVKLLNDMASALTGSFQRLRDIVGNSGDAIAAFLISLGGAIKQIRPFGAPLPGLNEIDAVLKMMANILTTKPEKPAEAGGGEFGEGKPAGGKPGILPGVKTDALGALTGMAATNVQPQGFMANLVDGMRKAITSMQLAVTGAPSYTSGEQVYKEATLAGIGKDPFEKEMLDIMLKQLEAMNKVVAKLQPAVGP